jgi:hypothetical protein
LTLLVVDELRDLFGQGEDLRVGVAFLLLLLRRLLLWRLRLYWRDAWSLHGSVYVVVLGLIAGTRDHERWDTITEMGY